MICVVSVIKYPKYFGFFGVLSMALFHLPLFFNKKISFYKLMGTGKNGSFDIHPDWNQWVVLIILNDELEILNDANRFVKLQSMKGSFINAYLKFFNCKVENIFMKPLVSHGTWDGKYCFGKDLIRKEFQGKIAVLTRATIRFNRLKNFWTHVPKVNEKMNENEGLIYSIGMGEIPFIKQATLSIWQDEASMKNFAYQQKEHVEVIQKTRKENWYSEEMFTRFEVIEII
ncbi:MAG: DUF3291 domain-containing protein [Chitinophagaceae bacterium]|nr:DUF3291 domain-containing protein [Chitinophagaceae bacterium]